MGSTWHSDIACHVIGPNNTQSQHDCVAISVNDNSCIPLRLCSISCIYSCNMVTLSRNRRLLDQHHHMVFVIAPMECWVEVMLLCHAQSMYFDKTSLYHNL